MPPDAQVLPNSHPYVHKYCRLVSILPKPKHDVAMDDAASHNVYGGYTNAPLQQHLAP
jgi:hypothetical protein